MRVSELARRIGVRPSAIRFYESEGILPDPGRGPNGYREYSDTDYCRARVFVTLRSLGIEPRESGRLAQLCASGECDEMEEQLLPRLRQRRDEIAAARAELDHLDAELARLELQVRVPGLHQLSCADVVGEEVDGCAQSRC